MTIGLNSGSPTPPGPRVGSQNYTIVGGTGAFFGARGQKGGANNRLSSAIPEAVGFPGAVDRYQVNFRVPPDISPGAATIQISTAWIPGAPVSIAVK